MPTNLLRLLTALLLGAGVAVLVSCGSSGAGLIPSENAGPLKSDFQAIAHAAETGDGDCSSTETAIHDTESDFHALPGSVDAALRARLAEGISHLRERALALCTEPLSQTATTGESTSTKTVAPPTTATTKTPTQTTSTAPTQGTSTTETTAPGVTPTTSQPPGSQGGTPVEEGGNSEGLGTEGAAGGNEGSSGGSEESGKSGGAAPNGGTGSGGGQ